MASTFSDGIHVGRIAEALWQRQPRGNAAVMVGAGFSRNARPRLSHDERPPTWIELAEVLHRALYTDSRGSGAGNPPVDGSSFLKLAQMFEATFGTPALEDLIIRAVADERQEPSELHDLLLRLPWSDIFTTNWDTLLERAATKILDRRFNVLTVSEEIPRSAQPRIVKLHGSLPSTRPFVATEEHYRTYPTQRASFVNLVQQSMMENVFCLLGFSGDDPNFLRWSGWVRDHLGEHAPHLYLVGWLDLTPVERRLLESRRVVPVDLARLPGTSAWPKENRHTYALEWFLHSLLASRPRSPSDWHSPERGVAAKIPPKYLPPLQAPALHGTRVVPPPQHGQDQLEPIRTAMQAWKANRRSYPGWLVAPHRIRIGVWGAISSWLPAVLETLPRFSLAERLGLLYEINWCFEQSLTPLSDDIATAISDALEASLEASGGVQFASKLQGDTRGLLVAHWESLALAVLRHARESARDEVFERWHSRLTEDPRPQNSEFANELEYEMCLAQLAMLDYQELRRRLLHWMPPSHMPILQARKAALLAQVGLVDEAADLSQAALSELRSRQPRDRDDLQSLSHEAWIMFLSRAFDRLRRLRAQNRDNDLDDARPSEAHSLHASDTDRWRFLRQFEVDPADELTYFYRLLEGPPPEPKPPREIIYTFDPGRALIRSTTLSFGSPGAQAEIEALRCLRLCEVVGLPALPSLTGLSGWLERRCAVWLRRADPIRATTAVLRTTSYDKDEVLDAHFSRLSVAEMDPSLLRRLHKSLLGCIDFGLACLDPQRPSSSSTDKRLFWRERVRVAMEVLSRLAVRSDVIEPQDLFDRASRYYKLSAIQQDLWLHEPLGNLFRRALSSTPPPDRRNYLLPMAHLPLPGTSRCDVDTARWEDPLGVVSSEFSFPQADRTSPEWHDVIHRFLAAARELNPRGRSAAVLRLEFLFRLGLLSDEEKVLLAECLWGYPRNRAGHLPCDIRAFERDPWVYLRLPEVQQGQAATAFRLRCVDIERLRTSIAECDVHSIAIATREASFELAASESQAILDGFLTWWKKDEHLRPLRLVEPFYALDAESFLNLFPVDVLTCVAPILNAQDGSLPELFNIYQQLQALGYTTYPTVPTFLRLCPAHSQQLLRDFRFCLLSVDRTVARGAMLTLAHWLRDVPRGLVAEVPADVLRELGLIVAARNTKSLEIALQTAAWVVANTDTWRGVADFVPCMIRGLTELAAETQYNGQITRPVAEQAMAPVIRSSCVRLAHALASASSGDDQSIVQSWLQLAAVDPLPEVRYALEESPS